MNKQNVIYVLTLVMTLICLTTSIGVADEPALCADSVFGSATAFLASNKLVVFDCVAYAVHGRIAITDVWLEQKVDGEWEYVKDLTPPSYVSINMPDYGAEVDYSASITSTGTFRVGFTVDADGYSISRYSNSRTF